MREIDIFGRKVQFRRPDIRPMVRVLVAGGMAAGATGSCQVVGRGFEEIGKQMQGADVTENDFGPTLTPMEELTAEPSSTLPYQITLGPTLTIAPTITSSITPTPSETPVPTMSAQEYDQQTRLKVINTERGDVVRFDHLHLTQIVEIDALLKKFQYGIISALNQKGDLESIAALGNFNCVKDMLVKKGVELNPIQVENGIFYMRNYAVDVILDEVNTERSLSILEAVRGLPLEGQADLPTFDVLTVSDDELLADEQLICPR